MSPSTARPSPRGQWLRGSQQSIGKFTSRVGSSSQELPSFFAAMDQPTNDGVNTYFVSKAARKAGLTVVLSGLGGDEVFWGYKHYRWLANGGPWLSRCPAPARKLFASGATWWGRVRGRDNWMRAAFLRDGASSRDVYLLMRGFFPPQHVQRLLGLTSGELESWVDEHFADFRDEPDAAMADEVNYIEMKRYLHDQLLRDSDVFSMAHSIELRVPLLDHPLVEAARRHARGAQSSKRRQQAAAAWMPRTIRSSGRRARRASAASRSRCGSGCGSRRTSSKRCPWPAACSSGERCESCGRHFGMTGSTGRARGRWPSPGSVRAGQYFRPTEAPLMRRPT